MNGSTVEQLQNSYSITESDLKPGDLGFQNQGMLSANHVGIFYKRDEKGVKQYIHCQGGVGVTINSALNSNGTPIFIYWRRPNVKFDDD